jgi:hypothetical protein
VLFGFLPFVLFAVCDHYVPTAAALLLATVSSALLLLRDRRRGKTLKLLDVGALIVFGGLSLYSELASVTWSVLGVRLCVDFGLFLVVVISIAIGQPFTLQYAREQAPPEVWSKPEFLRVNVRISSVWALAFGVMLLSDLSMLHGAPVALGGAGSVLALTLAAIYTVKVVRERQRLHAAPR